MTKLLKSNTPFVWNQKTREGFITLKDILTSESLLQYPDFTKPFILTTDASNEALGAILSRSSWTRSPNFICKQTSCKLREELFYHGKGASSYYLELQTI